MDFTLSEEQRELAALSRTILTGQLTPQRLRDAEAGPDRFDAALWADLAAAGILAAALPESLGGAGLGLLGQCSVLAEIGRTVAPVPYLPSIVLGAAAIARFGTAGQQRQWAGPAARGELILTAALAEDDGDDPRAPSARAERVPAGWLLSGAKTTVPAAPLAGLILLPAATPDGVAVFLVTPSDDGVTIVRQQVTSGDAVGRVLLDGVSLPGDRMLGRPGAAGHRLAGGHRHGRAVRAAGRGHRARPGADGGVCARPGAVRQADRRLPGGGAAPRRRLHRRGGGPPHHVAGGLAALGRPAVRHRDRHRQVLGRRRGPPRRAHRGARARRGRASTWSTRCTATSPRPSRTSSCSAAPPPSCAGSARHWPRLGDPLSGAGGRRPCPGGAGRC